MSEWVKKSLGDFMFFQRGHDLSRNNMKVGNIPVAGSNGVIGFHNASTTIAPGITIGRSGNIGTPHFYQENFWAHNTVLYVKDFKGNDPLFCYYLLKTIDFSGFNTGSAVPTLNRNHIHKYKINTPPVKEQKVIASVLSSLDDKIDLLHRQNKTLESMAETLFRQWFVEEAQDDYSDITIETVIETTSGGTPSRKLMEYYQNGNTFWVKSKELNGLFINSTEEKITDEAIKNSSAKLLPKHSILIAMYGATVGEYAVISKPMSCNQAICALKPNDNYPYTYIFMYVKTQKDELINQAVGSAQQNISQALIKKMKVSSNLGLINKYHNTVLHMFEKIEENSKQIQTLENLRDTLLPKLMSGEVRVNYTPEEIKQ